MFRYFQNHSYELSDNLPFLLLTHVKLTALDNGGGFGVEMCGYSLDQLFQLDQSVSVLLVGKESY